MSDTLSRLNVPNMAHATMKKRRDRVSLVLVVFAVMLTLWDVPLLVLATVALIAWLWLFATLRIENAPRYRRHGEHRNP